MNRVFCSGAAEWSSVLKLAASAVLFAGAGVVCAQALAANSQTATSAIPPSGSSSAILSSGNAVSSPANSGPLAAASLKGGSGDGMGFGLPPTQFPAPDAGYFQRYRGFQGGGTGFTGGSRTACGFSGFGGRGHAGIAGTAGFGFQGSFVPSASPNFNQMMRANLALPFATSIGTFKLTYRNMLIPGVNSGGGGPGTTGAMFSTTSLGNGVFFSAGTNIGKGSTAGMPPAGFGSNPGASGPKPARPAVTLKLSF